MIVGAMMVGVMMAVLATAASLALGSGLLMAGAVYVTTGLGALVLTLSIGLLRQPSRTDQVLVESRA